MTGRQSGLRLAAEVVPGDEHGRGEEEDPDEPHWIALGLALADRLGEGAEFGDGVRLGKVGLAGVGEVRGRVEEDGAALADAEKARFTGGAELAGAERGMVRGPFRS